METVFSKFQYSLMFLYTTIFLYYTLILGHNKSWEDAIRREIAPS